MNKHGPSLLTACPLSPPTMSHYVINFVRETFDYTASNSYIKLRINSERFNLITFLIFKTSNQLLGARVINYKHVFKIECTRPILNKV